VQRLLIQKYESDINLPIQRYRRKATSHQTERWLQNSTTQTYYNCSRTTNPCQAQWQKIIN